MKIISDLKEEPNLLGTWITSKSQVADCKQYVSGSNVGFSVNCETYKSASPYLEMQKIFWLKGWKLINITDVFRYNFLFIKNLTYSWPH